MPSPSVEVLREQLRERGYLSNAIERWFALDPWSSRAFWLELITVAAKAALLIALFGALPMTAIMLFRNHPLSPSEIFELTAIYAASWAIVVFALVLIIALALKLRPELAIDTPRGLLAISLSSAGALWAGAAGWWYGFDAASSTYELIAGALLSVLFFIVATIVISAALLSFSIYELQRIPAIHQKPRGAALTMAAAVLTVLLFIPAYGLQEHRNAVLPPQQVITTPTSRRLAFIAVDGLTFDLFRSRPPLTAHFAAVSESPAITGDSTAERWATIGTGVPARLHGVRAIEAIRLRGGSHLVQQVSANDPVLRQLAPAMGIAARQALPPAVRRRDYIWEIFAKRGRTSLAVNWWTTNDLRSGGLTSIGQSSIFATAGRTATRTGEAAATALRIDEIAARAFLARLKDAPSFATIYLPALDVVLNRLTLRADARLGASVRALDLLDSLVADVERRGYDVVLAGLPGDRQGGAPLVATSFATNRKLSVADIAPALCTWNGFPASDEMTGRDLATAAPRIATYGPRTMSSRTEKADEEYYRNLRSLGYIR